MQTPGILVMSRNGKEGLGAMAEYARTAEQIGLRSFLVTEGPATDALAVTQHIASITSRIQVGTGSRISTRGILRSPPPKRCLSTLWLRDVCCSDWAP